MTIATPPRAPERSDVLEFRLAMEEYKRRSGRMFPTWSKVLEVLRGPGYEEPAGAELTPAAPAGDHDDEPEPVATPRAPRPSFNRADPRQAEFQHPRRESRHVQGKHLHP